MIWVTPARWSRLMAMFRIAMVLGPDRALTCDLPSWYRAGQGQRLHGGERALHNADEMGHL